MAAESLIERSLCKFVKQRYGIDNRKLTAKVGDPDRLFLYKGAVVFVEFKAPTKVPRKAQENIHKELRNNGFSTLVIDDLPFGRLFFANWARIIDKQREVVK